MVASDADKRIGQNVAALRGEMSQQQLADKMRERGHKWSQSTVWSVEKGDRPLRVSESVDLEEIFDSHYVAWTRSEDKLTSLGATGQHAMDARHQAVDALVEHLRWRQELLREAAGLWEQRPDLRERIRGWIRKAAGRGSDLSWLADEARARLTGDGRLFLDPEPGSAYPFKREDEAMLRGDDEFRREWLEKIDDE